MGKNIKDKKATEEKSLYPSMYGSHSSMIDEAATNLLSNPKTVALKDQHGIYVTLRNRLDNGLADPNRYCGRVMNIQISNRDA